MSKLRRDEISHSLFPSHTHTELKLTLPESPDVAEVELHQGGGREAGERGLEVEDKASSRASNSILMDLLPI